MNASSTYIGRPIRSLQTMLRVIAAAEPSLPSIVPDGIYGPDTQAAVTAFQARCGLPQTGVTDQQTWDRIVSIYLGLRSAVYPAGPLRIRWQPQQTITAGEQNLHLYPIQAMFAALCRRFSDLSAPPVNGRHGPESVAAVQQFQRICGLEPSGSIDQTTWEQLGKLYALISGDGDRPEAADLP